MQGLPSPKTYSSPFYRVRAFYYLSSGTQQIKEGIFTAAVNFIVDRFIIENKTNGPRNGENGFIL